MNMNMNKTKKVLLGTALAGAVVVGAGFGTFSWFTSSANVSGEVLNSTLEIEATEEFNLTVQGGHSALAPGRTAIGSATIENTAEEEVILTGAFTFTVTKGESNVTEELLRGYDVEVFINDESEPKFTGNAAQLQKADVLNGITLANDEDVEVELKVSLDGPSTGDDYQGANLSVNFETLAKQTDDGAQFTNN
ncbi:hypothetical protein AB685_21505 [Bacillus sp. LL01]|uniref:hypothetical protein n=1 Tax=Bacillus sp. LL01 TaxID=1665556 RepID=UPI00064CE1AD|nr:hypothetical protein [Bacillus sp. LL01]KMJ56506.1 hypothetical protein AB685_21505 [Bacillus sp. LL01]